MTAQLTYCDDDWYLVEIYFNWVFYTFLCDDISGVKNLSETFIEDWKNSKSHWDMNESQDQELLDLMKRLQHNMKGLIRGGTPDEVYEDYFLELKESENFRVRINKGNGFVTHVEINGMIDVDKAESEFNRILNKMKMIKERLHNRFDFDCHFMIWLNGQPQQDLNDKTHRNDDYKFKGVGSKKRGYDKDFYYTDGEISQWDRSYKPFPDDKVAIDIKFMIV